MSNKEYALHKDLVFLAEQIHGIGEAHNNLAKEVADFADEYNKLVELHASLDKHQTRLNLAVIALGLLFAVLSTMVAS